MIPTHIDREIAKLEEVLIEYDGPQLFTIRAGRKVYLALHGPDEDNLDVWLYVPTSWGDLNKLKSSRISLRDHISSQQFALIGKFSGDLQVELQRVDARTLSDAILPDPDAFLPQPSTRSVLYPPNTVGHGLPNILDAAKAQRKIFIDLKFRMGEERQDVSLSALGETLASVQNLYSSIAGELIDAKERGKLPIALLQRTNLAAVAIYPSSFAIRIESENGFLVGDSVQATAIERLASLLEVKIDQNDISQSIENFSSRTKSHYLKLIKSIEKAEAPFFVEIAHPDASSSFQVSFSRDEIHSLHEITVATSRARPEIQKGVGRLQALNLKTKYFLIENGDRFIAGRIDDDLVAQMDGKKVGVLYDYEVEVTLEDSDVTGAQKTKFRLLKISLQ